MDRPLRLISTDTIVGTPIDALARTHRGAARRRLAAALRRRARGGRRRGRRARRDRARARSASATARAGAGSCSSASRAATRSAPSREAAEACGRLFERPVERGLSQAALETLAVVAYLGPVSRPEIARIRGVAADSTVASLVERGLVAEAGRESAPGRRRPLPRDAALRARLRARHARRAAAARRPRRRAGGDPRAPARGRRGPRLVDARNDRTHGATARWPVRIGASAASPSRSSRTRRSSTSPARGRCSRAWATQWPDDGVEVFTVAARPSR